MASEGVTGPRFCKTCVVYKPPRSHHCRYCGRCVLKMDHHCPWINNCVGHDNYGHFLRFIVFANTACFYVLMLLIGRVRYILDALRHYQVKIKRTRSLIYPFNAPASMALNQILLKSFSWY